MSLEFYTPYGYDSEIEVYKFELQNYAIDFKIKTAPTNNVLSQNSSYIAWDVPYAIVDKEESEQLIMNNQELFRKQVPFTNTVVTPNVAGSSSYYQRVMSDFLVRSKINTSIKLAWRSSVYFKITYDSCVLDSVGDATLLFNIVGYSDSLEHQRNEWISENGGVPAIEDYYGYPVVFLIPTAVEDVTVSGTFGNDSTTLYKAITPSDTYTTTEVIFDNIIYPANVSYSTTALTLTFSTGLTGLSGNQDLLVHEGIRGLTEIGFKPLTTDLASYDNGMLIYLGKLELNYQANVLQKKYDLPILIKKGDPTYNPYTSSIKNLDNLVNRVTTFNLKDSTMYNYIDIDFTTDKFALFNIALGRSVRFTGTSVSFYNKQLLSVPGSVIKESGIELKWSS